MYISVSTFYVSLSIYLVIHLCVCVCVCVRACVCACVHACVRVWVSHLDRYAIYAYERACEDLRLRGVLSGIGRKWDRL